DRLLFSKGHAAPLFYAMYAVAGAMPLAELQTLRKFGSRLEGHPTPEFPYTDAATGSLGQGLSIGGGMAYTIKNLRLKTKKTPRVYVLLGDGELAEGQVWEAANFASHYRLNNLIAIADINRLAQSQETMFGHHLEQYQHRFKAFGFETIVIDGHDFAEIKRALDTAQKVQGQPVAIIMKTFKGKGVSFLQNAEGWHGKALKKDELEQALQELGPVDETLRFNLKQPPQVTLGKARLSKNHLVFDFKKGDMVATREVYGKILAQLGNKDQTIYALDGDVKNSTFSQDFLKAHPNRFIECFIAEQNMVSVAAGLSRLSQKPFVSTFAAFLTRAADQIRMAALSQASIHFVGSHVGVSIGEDGASQMGLEDISLFGTIPQSIVLQPSDAVSAAYLLRAMIAHRGISYMRTLRPKTPVMYDEDEEFEIGGSKVLKSSKKDSLTIAATGITVQEALKAQEILSKEGISVRVIDCYSIKPVDKDGLLASLKATQKKIIVTVEDHFEHGGFGDFVLAAVSGSGAIVAKMAVDHISRSGTKDELLADARIDSAAIVQKVKNLLD
ncbi:MAG TPA: transketolase, partial [Patescibacteria group bacterium]|nr:transketolase [Patescibacteria group bacterium]